MVEKKLNKEVKECNFNSQIIEVYNSYLKLPKTIRDELSFGEYYQIDNRVIDNMYLMEEFFGYINSYDFIQKLIKKNKK